MGMDTLVIEKVVSSCPSLEFLELENLCSGIHIIASKSLKILILTRTPVGQHTEILCPNLEKLSINDLQFDQLVIASKSLKKLVLHDIDPSFPIEISCPNIEELTLEWPDIENYNLMNLPSSTCVTLGCVCSFHHTCAENFMRRTLEQLQQVKELRVNTWFVEFLSSLEFGGLSYPLLNIKCLTLDGPYLRHIWGVVNALRCSPALERLVINEFNDYNGDLTKFEEDCMYSNGIDFTCLVLHLKTVKIIGLSEMDGQCKALPFVGFLLKNARKLEKMVVTLRGGMTFQVKVLAKLLSFPRCSPQAIIELSNSRH